MNAPNLAPLVERKVTDIDEATIREVTEGVWFGMRTARIGGGLDIRNGVWWTHSGSHIVSLATGSSLHGYGGVDWETYVFKGEPNYEDDVCCHESFDAAQACALSFIRSGHWCRHEEASAS